MPIDTDLLNRLSWGHSSIVALLKLGQGKNDSVFLMYQCLMPYNMT